MIDRTILQRLPTLALAAYKRANWDVLDIGVGVKASLTPVGDATVVAIPGTDPENWSDSLPPRPIAMGTCELPDPPTRWTSAWLRPARPRPLAHWRHVAERP